MPPLTSPALIQHSMTDTNSELLLSVFVIFSLLLIDEELLSWLERVGKLFIYIFCIQEVVYTWKKCSFRRDLCEKVVITMI